MANIPTIRRSLAPLSNIRKRGQIQFPQKEDANENENKRPVRLTERRFKQDRRNKNIKMMTDRRQINDRRNNPRFNRSYSDDKTTGQMIDTTA